MMEVIEVMEMMEVTNQSWRATPAVLQNPNSKIQNQITSIISITPVTSIKE
jgi:hypothetical protein